MPPRSDHEDRAIESSPANEMNTKPENETEEDGNTYTGRAIISRKRKADVLGRRSSCATSTGISVVAAAAASGSGRGSIVGWTNCPICGPYSKKRFALGRGIASHLHAVHTPWKTPSKAEQRRQEKRRRHEQQRKLAAEVAVPSKVHVVQPRQSAINLSLTNTYSTTGTCTTTEVVLEESYEPTPEQVEAWEEQVLQIINSLEKEAHTTAAPSSAPVSQHGGSSSSQDNTTSTTTISTTKLQHRQPQLAGKGKDRNGNHVKSYRDSLPPFLKAAENGDLETLQQMVTAAAALADDDDGSSAVIKLLETRDRHLSTAEHWAAGEGHLKCLTFLLNEKNKATQKSSLPRENNNNSDCRPSSSCATVSKKVRRRDGKTCLHYAARNGRLKCVQFLVDDGIQHGHEFNVDELSGDGTTPFHLACWNLQLKVAKFLVQRGANPKATNEWGCSAAHWVGMARGCRDDLEQQQQEQHLRVQVRAMCNWMQEELDMSFVERQKQGHCALHKAAQHCNQYFIEWLAQPREQGGAGLTDDEKVKVGLPDLGGHIPSEIWQSSGGNEAFAKWMKDELGW